MVWPIMALGLQVHAPQQVDPARVGAQRIESWVSFNAIYRTVLITFFQPLERLIFLSEGRINVSKLFREEALKRILG
jgi:hypothetical protein